MKAWRTSVSLVLLGCLFAVMGEAQTPPSAPPPKIVNATDGIFAAFQTHPLVGLDDTHGLAQEEDFYATLVRDPRFAREVGNVVVEFGGAEGQSIIDRYVNGERVPYMELRKVWTQVAGWIPTVTGLGYMKFYAQVRAVNLSLPQKQRIHVWLGEPKIDWAKIKTQADVMAIVSFRDSHAADVIKREILAKKKKALVIYGSAHLTRPTPEQIAQTKIQTARQERQKRVSMPKAPQGTVLTLTEQDYPGAFFTVSVYAGYIERNCSENFEKSHLKWPNPALVTPLRNSPLANELWPKNCHFAEQGSWKMIFKPGTSAKEQAIALEKEQHDGEQLLSGIDADGLLYLGPANNLTHTPDNPDVYLDEAFRAEISRRGHIFGDTLPNVQDYVVSPRKWRDY